MAHRLGSQHLLEHQPVRAGIDGDHHTGQNEAAAAGKKLPGLGQGPAEPGAAVSEIGRQKKHRQHNMVQGGGHGKPQHAFPQHQQDDLIDGHGNIGRQGRNGRVFRLKPRLEPVIQRVKHLKNKADAVKRRHRHRQLLALVDNADDPDDGQRRQKAGRGPQQQGGPDGLALLLRMVRKVLHDHAVDAQSAERGEERGVCGGVIDQAVAIGAQIARRENAHHKGQDHVGELSENKPPRVFNDPVFDQFLQHSLRTPS